MQRQTHASEHRLSCSCRALSVAVALITCVVFSLINANRLTWIPQGIAKQREVLNQLGGRNGYYRSSTTTTKKLRDNTFISTTQTIKPTAVCTVASNPRQGSIFRTNLMATLGSGKYNYAVTPAGKCAWAVPRVRLIPFIKCCTKLHVFLRTVSASVSEYDVIIITGDEYCAIQEDRAHFRQYHSSDVLGLSHPVVVPGLTTGGDEPVKFPQYMPLGPRAEFARVQSFELHPPAQRNFLFNFLGAMTSTSRKRLNKIVAQESFRAMDFTFAWHSVGRWTANIDKGEYTNPHEYREILLSSQFTLCPAGHNPESFRIFEACEAGSIPVLTRDNRTNKNNKTRSTTATTATTQQRCINSYRPLLESGAPFVMLDDWNELPAMLEHARRNASYVLEKYVQVQEWYARYMKTVAFDFEAVLEYRFRERMRRGGG